MRYVVYRHRPRQNATTVFHRLPLGTVDAPNMADAIAAAMQAFEFPRAEVALESQNGERLYGRNAPKRRPWTMNGE